MTIRVIAHRTASRDARANSLDGIKAAATLLADGVEVDVRATRDGVPILEHDSWLARRHKVPIATRWASSSLASRLHIPTLADALETARAANLLVVLDTKEIAVVPAVIDVVNSASMADAVLPWSDRMPVVRAYIRAWPLTEVTLARRTTTDDEHRRLLRDAEAIGAGAVCADQDAVTPDFIASAADHDLRVYVYYETLEQQAAKLPKLAPAGLHGVITDWPAPARATLEHA